MDKDARTQLLDGLSERELLELQADVEGELQARYRKRATAFRLREARRAPTPGVGTEDRCHADRDGECSWQRCPQLRDDEPRRTGRHCPIDVRDDED